MNVFIALGIPWAAAALYGSMRLLPFGLAFLAAAITGCLVTAAFRDQSGFTGFAADVLIGLAWHWWHRHGRRAFQLIGAKSRALRQALVRTWRRLTRPRPVLQPGRAFGAVIATVLVLALASCHPDSAKAASSGWYTCARLEHLWVRAGGSSSKAAMAASIAQAESSGVRTNSHVNKNGSTDEGLWQINNRDWPQYATYSAIGSAKGAVAISHNGRDWTAWKTYTTGAYQGKC